MMLEELSQRVRRREPRARRHQQEDGETGPCRDLARRMRSRRDLCRLCPNVDAARLAYVAEQYSTMVGLPVTPDDVQAALAWALLSRQEEEGAPRDRHGNFTADESLLTHLGLLEYPPLHDDIRALAGEASLPRWPRNHRFALCLTHDVDVVVGAPWLERLRRLTWCRHQVHTGQLARWLSAAVVHLGSELLGWADQAPFDAWMDAEQQHGFHSTFFVMPESYGVPTPFDHFHRYDDPVVFGGVRMTYAEAARLARGAGWEIGLHGSYASARDGALLAAEKAQVERMLGTRVVSARQHFLRFEASITPRLLEQVGIRVDSTLGYSTTIGCRAGLAFPYFWPDGDLLEVPLVIQDIGVLRKYQSLQPGERGLRRATALLKRIADVGGVVTLDWHPHSDFRGALAGYHALLRVAADLGAWGCTLGELNAWWRSRRERVRMMTAR
jgi:hypothetical protein